MIKNKYLGAPLVLAEQMTQMDRATCQALAIDDKQLMHNAAKACFERMLSYENVQHVTRVTVLCGGGGNGGDGYVIAALFAHRGCKVSVLEMSNVVKSAAAAHYRQTALHCENVTLVPADQHEPALIESDVVVDAVYGTGFRGELTPLDTAVFGKVRDSGAYAVSVDLPSGVYCDSGGTAQGAFSADLTVTFEFLKPALVSYPAKAHCGTVEVVPIGYPRRVREGLVTDGVLLDSRVTTPFDTPRPQNSHKGTFGRLLMSCGSDGMTGAPYFAAMGALRSGIGLLYAACDEHVANVLQARLSEPIFIKYRNENDLINLIGNTGNYDIVLRGCGSGFNDFAITEFLVTNCKTRIILDADALRELARHPVLFKNLSALSVLTPHPGEMAELCGTNTATVQADRITTARNFAAKSGCTVVLKGAATVIASPDGRYAVNSTGNAGMAKGGCGDILAGMIAGYCATSDDMFAATCAAVYTHGAIGDRCSAARSQRSMLPSDMLEFL